MSLSPSAPAASSDLSAHALSRLLQLASPALPVGAYSYSQGLEAAVESGIAADAAGVGQWIGDVMASSMARLEAPAWWRLQAAWSAGDMEAVRYWNDWFIATRETAELRAETLQMGYSLRRLMLDVEDLGLKGVEELERLDDMAFPTAFAFAAVRWGIPPRMALGGYVWSWLENQVMAALKAVPLGQTDGQRLLAKLGARIPAICEEAVTVADEDLSNFMPGLAILSSVHETQYSRLFRS